jgi:hypothetical protein
MGYGGQATDVTDETCQRPTLAAFLALPFGDFSLDALSSFPAHEHRRVAGLVIEYLRLPRRLSLRTSGVVTMSTWAGTSARRCCTAHHLCIVRASQSSDLRAGSYLPGGISKPIGKRLWRRAVLLEMYSVS